MANMLGAGAVALAGARRKNVSVDARAVVFRVPVAKPVAPALQQRAQVGRERLLLGDGQDAGNRGLTAFDAPSAPGRSTPSLTPAAPVHPGLGTGYGQVPLPLSTKATMSFDIEPPSLSLTLSVHDAMPHFVA